MPGTRAHFERLAALVAKSLVDSAKPLIGADGRLLPEYRANLELDRTARRVWAAARPEYAGLVR